MTANEIAMLLRSIQQEYPEYFKDVIPIHFVGQVMYRRMNYR